MKYCNRSNVDDGSTEASKRHGVAAVASTFRYQNTITLHCAIEMGRMGRMGKGWDVISQVKKI